MMYKLSDLNVSVDRNNDGVIRYINNNHDLDPDEIVLLISLSHDGEMKTSYHKDENKTIKHIRLSLEDINQWVLSGRNRKIIQWLLEGEIISDPSGQLTTYIQELNLFPPDLRKKRILVEFSQLVRRYVESRNLIKRGNIFDSYSNILRALHHWARLKIIQSGKHPEVTVWSQVRQINPEVYKMYEELINGMDSLEQRIELVLLASEFFILSEIKESTGLLFDILRSEKEPQTFEQVSKHSTVADLPIDFDVLLAKLVKKSIIKEEYVSNDYGTETGFMIV